MRGTFLAGYVQEASGPEKHSHGTSNSFARGRGLPRVRRV